MTNLDYKPLNMDCVEIKPERYAYVGWCAAYTDLAKEVVRQHCTT